MGGEESERESPPAPTRRPVPPRARPARASIRKGAGPCSWPGSGPRWAPDGAVLMAKGGAGGGGGTERQGGAPPSAAGDAQQRDGRLTPPTPQQPNHSASSDTARPSSGQGGPSPSPWPTTGSRASSRRPCARTTRCVLSLSLPPPGGSALLRPRGRLAARPATRRSASLFSLSLTFPLSLLPLPKNSARAGGSLRVRARGEHQQQM